MKKYSWGVDGLGRQHICLNNDVRILLCVLPNESLWVCMDLLSTYGNHIFE